MAETRNAPYARNQRALYRKHLVKAANNPVLDYDYNPALDDPSDPRNPRGWTHGMIEGYRVAGCKCPQCKEIYREVTDQEIANRVANRVANHRALLTVLLAQELPDTTAEQATEGAAVVVATHRVTDRFRAILTYDPVKVRKQLRQWGAPGLLALGDDALTDLVTTMIERLR